MQRIRAEPRKLWQNIKETWPIYFHPRRIPPEHVALVWRGAESAGALLPSIYHPATSRHV